MFFEELFKVEPVWGCGAVLGIEREAGDLFFFDVDGHAFANFEGDISFAYGRAAWDVLADFDGELCEAAVEALDDVTVGEAMAEEDDFSFVATGFSGVEDESGAGGARLVGWEALEASCRGKEEVLHGGHGAEIGLEFGGDEFGGAFFFASAHFDGIARDGVGFLPVP